MLKVNPLVGFGGINPTARGITATHKAGPSTMGTSHSFSDVNFGDDFPGRRIAVLAFVMSKNTGDTVGPGQTLTNVNIGDAPTQSPITIATSGHAGSSSIITGLSLIGAFPTGLTGTISFNTSFSTRAYIVVLSAPYRGDTAQGAQASVGELSVWSTSTPTAIEGYIYSGFVSYFGNGASFTAGMTQRGSENPFSNYHLRWGWIDRPPTSASHTVTVTDSSTIRGALGTVSRSA